MIHLNRVVGRQFCTQIPALPVKVCASQHILVCSKSYSTTGVKSVVRAQKWPIRIRRVWYGGRDIKDSSGKRPPKFPPKAVPQVVREPRERKARYISRYFSLTAPSTNVMTKELFLESLLKICSRATEKEPIRYRGPEPVVTILATPTFTTWLDDEAFMSSILKILFELQGRTAGQVPALKVGVFSAVVDGLPLSSESSSNSLELASPLYSDTAEGLSFMIGHSDLHFLSKPSEPLSKAKKRVDDSTLEPPEAITFDLYRDTLNREKTKVTFPLANTLFRNGKKVTHFTAVWERESYDSQFLQKSRIIGNELQIGLNLPTASTITRMKAPLHQLTYPRKIVSGLGNIIRQIDDAKGLPQPASTELEAAVETYQVLHKSKGQGVSVWAAVMTPEMLSPDYASEFKGSTKKWYNRVRNSFAQQSTENFEIGSRLDGTVGGTNFGMGAKLYRVLSGGGGWGVKAGLLSLDPQTTYTTTPTARYDFQELDAGAHSSPEALGDVAKPGSMITFWIAHDPSISRGEDPDSEAMQNIDKLTKPFYAKTVLGCMPSTIDDLPDDSTSTVQDGEEFKGHMGLFGAMSEAGIYVETVPRLRDHTTKFFPFPPQKTKMDVPFGTYEMGLRRPAARELHQQKYRLSYGTREVIGTKPILTKGQKSQEMTRKSAKKHRATS